MRCPVCGTDNNDDTRYCDYCGADCGEQVRTSSEGGISIPSPIASSPSLLTFRPSPLPPCKKHPVLAALLSVFPGLGQVYNGNLTRGFYFFIGTFAGLIALILPGILIWLYGIYDAYRTTGRMMAGELPCVRARKTCMGLFVVGAILLVCIVAVVIAMALIGLTLMVNQGSSPTAPPFHIEVPWSFSPPLIPNCGDNYCLPDVKCCNHQCFNSTVSSTVVRTFPYLLRGKKGSVQIHLFESLDQIYSPKKGSLTNENVSSFYLWYVNQSCQTTHLSSLIDQIRNVSSTPDDQVRIAISLIQHIPYDEIKAAEKRNASLTLPKDEYGFYTINDTVNASILLFDRYPYNVLYENTGICSEKSTTLALLLKELGYGVVLFHFPAENHMAAGVKCPLRYSYRQSGYCFIETTKTSIITDSSGTYGPDRQPLTSSPFIINVTDGQSFESVDEEYTDLQELRILQDRAERNHHRLYAKDYSRFNTLIDKYGLG